MAKLKFVLALGLLLVWGPYLLMMWIVPGPAPAWAMQPGFRTALMLSRDYEPTIFTLLFGLGFSGVALWGLIALLNGTARLNG